MNPLLVWVSDLHINSKTALRYPSLQLDDGDWSFASDAQKALWKGWEDFWNYIELKAKTSLVSKRPVYVIFGGEIADKDAKNRTNQIITKNEESIFNLTTSTLEPALTASSKTVVLRGTEAHVGQDSVLDERVAKDITNIVPDEDRGTASWYHARLVIGKFSFDFAHHVTMGCLPWTERNAANKLAKVLIDEYCDWGEKPPDFALRGHVHRFSDSGMNFTTRALISGCWTFPNAYYSRIGAMNKKSEIGGWIIDTETGEVEKRTYEPKRNPPRHI